MLTIDLTYFNPMSNSSITKSSIYKHTKELAGYLQNRYTNFFSVRMMGNMLKPLEAITLSLKRPLFTRHRHRKLYRAVVNLT